MSLAPILYRALLFVGYFISAVISQYLSTDYIRAIDYTDFYDSGQDGVNTQNDLIINIVSGDRAEYEIESTVTGDFKIIIQIGCGLPEDEVGDTDIKIVNGSDCDVDAMNSLQLQDFYTNSWENTQNKDISGYIHIEKGVSTISVCFLQTPGLSMRAIQMQQTTDAPTPAPETPSPSSSLSSNQETSSLSSSTSDELTQYQPPISVQAISYNVFHNDDTDEGPYISTGYLENVESNDYAQYVITVENGGNYRFSAVLFGYSSTSSDLKMHFEYGETECSESDNQEYFPTITEENFSATNDFDTYVASNNVMALSSGNQTVTVCFDEITQVKINSFLIEESSDSVEYPPSSSSRGVLFGSEAYTLLLILAVGSVASISVFSVQKLLNTSKTIPKEAKPTVTEVRSQLDYAEDDLSFSPSPFAGMEQQSSFR